MLKVNNIMERRKQEKDKIRSLYGLLGSTRGYLPDRMRENFDELMIKMRELTAEIERETGWEYNGYGFVSFSNYVYNAEKEQIDFIQNEIENGQNGFVPAHNTQRETDFIKRNAEKLDLLDRMTSARNVYDAYGFDEMVNTDDPELDERVRLMKRPPQYEIVKTEELVSAEMAANRFYNDFGNEGLITLIKWLNRLANADKPTDVYDELLGGF